MQPTRRTSVRITGRILYLTRDPDLLQRQLDGEDLEWDESIELIDNISTDEITPSWICYYYDEKLADYALIGLRGGLIKPNAIKDGDFGVIVSGLSKGCGSSRETAPFSELKAGVHLVVARSIEKIYRQNCQNIGLLTSTDFGLLDCIKRGEELPIDAFTDGLDEISAQVVEHGGLFAYNRARLAGHVAPPIPKRSPRPMTICEKIIAAHAISDASTGQTGVDAVVPGDSLFARTDVRFTHEYVTPMAAALFRSGLGDDATVSEPGSVFAFRDHLTFLDSVMPAAHRELGLDVQAASLATAQEEFCAEQGIKLYGEVTRDGKLVGSEAICHNKVIEELANPGDLVTGTDSHTCMAGALGCFAFGVGSTDMANAWFTRDVRVRVPETARFVLRGKLSPGVVAKDVILQLLSMDFFKSGEGIGKVLEFAGPAVRDMELDERATLTNMAVEAGGFTGIVEADEVVVDYLKDRRSLSVEQLRAGIVRADEGASYCASFDVDLANLEPMVATPGDPRNGVRLTQLGDSVTIDIAYGGSCTGGKKADMAMYANVLEQAKQAGMKIADGVRFFIQFGSQEIRADAIGQGFYALFEEMGVELIDPSCGACIKAGPGVSERADEVTISAINRNFPGRSGPGQVYLASPLTVAASAIAGHICSADELFAASNLAPAGQ
ncbi:MAG: 3-isopropylmalate dehydratase [Planctomycetes bacterium]|nr:3-isopropylmalate dehydratase [Planctomycetota bacterium]